MRQPLRRKRGQNEVEHGHCGGHAPMTSDQVSPPTTIAHLTRDLVVKLAGRNITVNALAPGPFPSQMNKWMLENF